MKMKILKKRFGNFRISFNKDCTLAGIVKDLDNRIRIIVPLCIVDMENPYQLCLYGYAVVKFMNEEVWSLIDGDGNIIIKAPVITTDSNRLYGFETFTVLLGDGNGNYSIYDPLTSKKSKCSYTRFENCGSYIKVYQGKNVGAMSLDFQEFIEPTHQDVQKVNSSIFKVKDEKTCKLYNFLNNHWSKPYYDFILHSSYIETIKEGRGIIENKTFNEILEPIYRKVEEFGTLYKGVCHDLSEVIMAKEWKAPSEKCVKIYEEVNGFIRAIVTTPCSVSRNLGYIFINRKNGLRLIDQIYDTATDAKNDRGLVWARIGTNIYFIDVNGRETKNVAKTF